MGRTKHKKIVEVNTLANVFNPRNNDDENCLRKYFQNNNEIILEIGCGHGDYTLSLSNKNKGKNFVGVDLKGARIWVGAKTALSNNLTNAAFLMMNSEVLANFFKTEKVEEIIIPFPDPHIRRTSESRRLISPNFIGIYRSILKKEGTIHLKTDNAHLFEYAVKVLESERAEILFGTDDLYSLAEKPYYSGIQTKYEKHYLTEGRKIKYLVFKL